MGRLKDYLLDFLFLPKYLYSLIETKLKVLRIKRIASKVNISYRPVPLRRIKRYIDVTNDSDVYEELPDDKECTYKIEGKL